MKITKVEVEIEGTAALLQHKMPEQDVNAPLRKTRQSDVEDPKDFLYTDGKRIVQPATHIERALVQVASAFKMVGRGKKTYKDAAKTIIVMPELIPHKVQKWVPYTAAVVIPSTKGRVNRIRPRFDAWKIEFEIQFDADIIPTEVVKQMLETAGTTVGIGDWRPRFGRFMVTSFKTQ
jgi:hypothetical protein